ncbi:transglutaminase domain-containing protein [Butyrivibrio sp. FC2001]|nr:transglutaminase domain-containing protein [Butyrivibrio sp. FC2001]
MLKKSIITAVGALFAVLTIGNPIKAEAMANGRTWSTYITQTGYFYEQLDPKLKKAYRAYTELMVERRVRFVTYFDINARLGITDDSEKVTEDEQHVVEAALGYDHPAIITRINDSHTQLELNTDCMNEVLSQAAEVVSSFGGMEKNEKVKGFHDYLVTHITYSKTASHASDAYGALIGGKCLCVGYADAFNLLCNMADIECVKQDGMALERHVWNIVQLQDGEWYEVDCTWDDWGDDSPVLYDYYLKNRAYMNAHNHVHYEREETDPYGCYYCITPPVANGTKYEYKPISTPNDAIGNDSENTNGQTSSADSSNNATYNNQQAADNNAVAQNSNVPDDKSEKNIVSGKVYAAESGEDVTVSGSEACIVKGSGSRIPSYVTVDGHSYEVTEIGDEAYSDNKDIKSVTIP